MANGDTLWANEEGHDLWDDLRSSIDETRSLRRELMSRTTHLDEQIRHLKVENTSMRAENSSMKATIMSLEAENSSTKAKVMSLEAENSSTKAELVDLIEKLQVYKTFKTLIYLTDAKIDTLLGSSLRSVLSTPSCEVSQRPSESSLGGNGR